jgi:hypothetical protein
MLLYNTIRDGLRSMRGTADGRIAFQTNYIDMARETPYLQDQIEQMRAYSGLHRRRMSPFTDNWTGESPEMRIKYRAAMAEPTVKAALLGKIISVCSLNLEMRPKNRSDPVQHEQAACTRHALAAGPMGIPGVIWEILIGGLIDGWSVSEKVWGIEERGQYRGKRVLANLKGKDTRYIWPEVDEFRNVTALWNFRGNAGRRFDPSKFVIFSYLPLFQNPLGQSDVRASYRAVELLPVVLNLRSIFLEKYAGPYMVGKIKDRALKSKMLAELKQARGKGVIVLDEHSDVQVVDLATRGTSDFQSAIEDLRQEVAIGISGAFLHMLTGMNPEARGSSKVQQDTTEAFIWILSENVRALLKKSVVPDIVDYNHGALAELPDVELEAVNPEDVLKELAIDKLLNEIGVDLSLSATLDRARRIGPKDPATDVLKGRTATSAGGLPDLGIANPYGPGGSLRNFVEQFAERYQTYTEEAPFTGVITDTAGRKIHFVNGRRVRVETGNISV